MNIHGYFAGGGISWRESARLAEQLGWRVINPSLPGFGGSDSLDWNDVSMEILANQVMAVIDHVEAGPLVVLGHSMGRRRRTIRPRPPPAHAGAHLSRRGQHTGLEGRHGVVSSVLAPFAPNIAPMVDLATAAVSDMPDL